MRSLTETRSSIRGQPNISRTIQVFVHRGTFYSDTNSAVERRAAVITVVGSCGVGYFTAGETHRVVSPWYRVSIFQTLNILLQSRQTQ